MTHLSESCLIVIVNLASYLFVVFSRFSYFETFPNTVLHPFFSIVQFLEECDFVTRLY